MITLAIAWILLTLAALRFLRLLADGNARGNPSA